MKKLLKFVVLMVAIANLNAQIAQITQPSAPSKAPQAPILFTDFSGTTGTELPAGWTRDPDPTEIFQQAWMTGGGPNVFNIQGLQSPTGGRLVGVPTRSAISEHDNNAWMFSPAVELTAGATYVLQFVAIIRGFIIEGETSWDYLKIQMGQTPSVAGMAGADTVYINTNQHVRDWSLITVRYTAKQSGTHYLGFHAYTPVLNGYFIAIDEISFAPIRDNDLAITQAVYPFTQVPTNQTLLPTVSATVRNIGALPQTNVTLSVDYNGALLGTSAPIPSFAANPWVDSTLSVTTANNAIPLGNNTLTFTVNQTETDNDPSDNMVVSAFEGTNNIFAIDDGNRRWPISITLNNSAYGNIFPITQPTVLSAVSAAFQGGIGVKNANVVLYTMVDGRPAATPIFIQSMQTPAAGGWVRVVVPPTVLQPGNYFLAIQQIGNDTLGINTDGNPHRVGYLHWSTIFQTFNQYYNDGNPRGAVCLRMETAEVPADPEFGGVTTLAMGNIFNNLPQTKMLYNVVNGGLATLNVDLATASSGVSVAGLPIQVECLETKTLTVAVNSMGLPTGAYNGNFVLTTNDPTKPTVTVNVTGTVVNTAVVSQFIFEDFERTGTPAGWAYNLHPSAFARQTTGGLNNSECLRARIYGTSMTMTTFQAGARTSYVNMGSNPVLSFHYRVTTDAAGIVASPTNAAIGFVLVSTNNAQSWDTVWSFADNHTPSVDYAFVDLDVSSYANEYVLVQFWFRSPVNATNTGFLENYVWIDDVTIGTMPMTPIFDPWTPNLAAGTLFNNLPFPTPREYRVRNWGGVPLTISSLVSATAGITVPGLPITIQPFESGILTVLFDPVGLPNGAWNGNFVLATNDTSKPQVTVPVTSTLAAGVISRFIRDDFNVQSGSTVGALPFGWTSIGGQFARVSTGATGLGIDNTPCLRGSVINARVQEGITTCYVNMGTSPKLSFWYNATTTIAGTTATNGNAFSGAAFISSDNGITWDQVWTLNIGDHDSTTAFTYIEIDLPTYANELCMARIVFTSAANPAVPEIVFRLDDIVFGTHPPNELEALSLRGYPQPTVGTPFQYTIQLKNRGAVTQDSTTYSVKLMLKGGTEDIVVATVPGVEIQLDEIKEIVFDWTPTVAGSATLYGFIDFPADSYQDDNKTDTLRVQVLPAGEFNIVIGSGTELLGNIPINFGNRKNLSQSLYFPNEMGVVGAKITQLTYQSSIPAAQTVAPKRVTVWMGETDVANLQTGYINPALLTQVFDGEISFPSGQPLPLTITLDSAYVYTGRNLVIYMYRWDGTTNTGSGFLGTTHANSNRSRQSWNNAGAGIEFDPMNPAAPAPGLTVTSTALHTTPNIVMKLDIAGRGSLSGIVTDGTNPIEGALVRVFEATTLTDANGRYEFPMIAAGTYEIEVSKHIYLTQTQTVVISPNASVTRNFTLVFYPTFMVSGTIIASDTELPLNGATVALSGYETYSTTTDITGYYEIEHVYAGGEYTITASGVPGYQTYTSTIEVTDNDVTHNITLLENAYMPNNPTAEEVANDVKITWLAPGTPYTTSYILDDGTAEDGWRATTNNYLSLGNMFVVNESGQLTSVDVYSMTAADAGSRQVRIKIYNASRVLVDSSALFTFAGDNWVNVPLNNVPYSGTFYAMVEWHATPGVTNHFGYDNNGPSIMGGFSWIREANGNWGQWHVVNPNAGRGVFMIRANATTTGQAAKAYGVPVASSEVIIVNEPMDHMFERSNKTSIAPEWAALEYATEPGAEKAFLGEYVVYRFTQGQPQSEWTVLSNTISGTEYIDNAWNGLPWGIYQWAVVAKYSNNVVSNPRLTNIIMKDVYVPYTMNITSNIEADVTGATVTLIGKNENEQIYTLTSGSTGVTFPDVWRGIYDLEIVLGGHIAYTAELNITETGTYNAILTEVPYPVVNLSAVRRSQNVEITWDVPVPTTTYILDGGTAENGYAFNPGANVSAGNMYVVGEAGLITSVDIYTQPNAQNTNRQVRVDIYNEARQLVGSSEMFVLLGNNGWMNVPLLEKVPYSGTFYAMVQWSATDGRTHWLGFNETGPAEYRNNNAYFDGTTWHVPFHHLVQGGVPGVLMIRVNAELQQGGESVSYGTTTPETDKPVIPTEASTIQIEKSGIASTASEWIAPKAKAAATVESYTVYRLLEGANEGNWIELTTVTDPGHIDENITSLPIGTYQWAVKANYRDNNISEARLSNALSITPETFVDPYDLNVEVVGQSATFTWRHDGAVTFNVYLDGELVAEKISQKEYVFTDLELRTYTAGVEAVYASGFSNLTTTNFTIVETSIVTLGSNMFAVYPNPTADVLHIQTEQTIQHIFVLDLTGKVIIMLQGDHRTIDLQSLPIGNYIVRIHTETVIVPIKIVKQ
ncbi:MAG: carboxypeptidase regulatory-like domain-containing protein [Bacteroidales bacterium]|jgi:hypothetical protein|nr:carboxypeptidase regulatory-like domain-containing protein [Bacteroidales bacterium]